MPRQALRSHDQKGDAAGRSRASAAQDPVPAQVEPQVVSLSIIVKTLNEEAKIGRCLLSVAQARERLGDAVRVEVIVADSISSDRTVEIAARCGAKVVQLALPSDRGCGSGVQLGYQHSRGQFVMLLDGDMEIDPGFLPLALERMAADPRLAGVAGTCEDTQIRNWFDRRRARVKRTEAFGTVTELPGGGLYRRKAIEDAGGYAANRNLRAFEEAELGMRLVSLGWRLERIPTTGVRHTGHDMSSLGLIRRDWRTRRMDSAGILLRESFGRPWFWLALRLFAHPVGVLGFWVAVAAAFWLLPPGPAAIGASLAFVAALLGLSALKRSFVDAGLSLILWHLAAAGLVRGLLTSDLIPPRRRLESRVLAGLEGPSV